MKENNNNRSHYAKVLVLTIALIVLGVSISYAYFTSTISGDASQTSLKAGNFKIETNLDNVSRINNVNLPLIEASEKDARAEKVSFYVKSTSESTVDAKYFIYLKEITLTKNLYDNSLKWELLKNGEVIESGSFVNAQRTSTEVAGEAENVDTNAADIQLTSSEQTLSKSNLSGDTYLFRIWLENNANVNQINLTSGKFSGKLYLEAVPVSENNSTN